MRNSKTSSMGRLNPVAATDTKLGSSDGKYEEQQERYRGTQEFLASKFDVNSKNAAIMSNVPVAATDTKLGSSDGKYEEQQERYKGTQEFLASKFDINSKNDTIMSNVPVTATDTKLGSADGKYEEQQERYKETQAFLASKFDINSKNGMDDRPIREGMFNMPDRMSSAGIVDSAMKLNREFDAIPDGIIDNVNALRDDKFVITPIDQSAYDARKAAATNGCEYIARQYNLPEHKRDSYEKQQDNLMNMGCVHGISDIKAVKVYEGDKSEPGLLSNAEAMIGLYASGEKNRAHAELLYLSNDTDASMYAYLRSAKNDDSFTKNYFANEGLKAAGIVPMNESISSDERSVDIK